MIRRLGILFFLTAFFLPSFSYAQEFKLPNPPQIFEVTFSDVTKECTGVGTPAEECEIVVPWIGQYISRLYIFAVSLSTILAVVVIMIAGLIWTTAGGNQTQVVTAKNYISGAVLGLILMLGSYTILYLINPELVKFDGIRLDYVRNEPLEQEVLLKNSVSCRWEPVSLASFGGPSVTSNTCPFGMQPGENCDEELKKDGETCCCKALESSSNMDPAQITHASPRLAKLIDYINANRVCFDGSKCGVVVTSISDNNIINGSCKPWKSTGQSYAQSESTGNCQHSQSSNHYGALKSLRGQADDKEVLPISGFSCAVDFRARTQYECDKIWEAAVASGVGVRKDGAPNGGCEGNPIDHMHIALDQCP